VSINGDIHKLEPGALIDLYVLDLNSIGVGVVYYFYSGTDANFGNILFQGQTYSPWPVKIEGLEKRGSGSEKRPKAIISNYGQLITNELQTHQDLVGALVRRRRTFSQYLGTNVADSSAYAEELFFIEQKTREDAVAVEFELASAMDFVDKRLPGRTAIANACPWQYKTTANGSGCGWPGTDSNKWFDKSGNQVASAALDECGKRLSDCKLRFGADKPLDFGGFPALGRY